MYAEIKVYLLTFDMSWMFHLDAPRRVNCVGWMTRHVVHYDPVLIYNYRHYGYNLLHADMRNTTQTNAIMLKDA
jgi:hypothetical protein